jgi:hypothetical protein
MQRDANSRGIRFFVGWGFVLLLALLVVPASAAWAGDDATAREVEMVKARIEALLREAGELEAAGRTEAAQEARAQARQIKGRLAQFLAKQARGKKAQKKKQRKAKEKGAKGKRGDKDLRRILAGLEHGIGALEALGGHEEAIEHLKRIAHGVGERMKRGEPEKGRPSEREMAEHHLEMLRLAHHALREARRGEHAEIVEHALHAMELRLEGRRDEEARHVYETAPPREAVLRSMHLAAELWADWGKKDRAHALMQHLKQVKRAHAGDRTARAERERDRPRRTDREHLAHEIELLHLALPVLREEGKTQTIEVVERAIHARKLIHSGRRDEEAREIIADQPPPAHVAEIMFYAADLWLKYENPEKAERCAEMGRHYQQIARRHRDREHAGCDRRDCEGCERCEQARRDREHAEREHHEREHREHREHGRPDLERLEELQRQVRELQEALRGIQAELARFARRR